MVRRAENASQPPPPLHCLQICEYGGSQSRLKALPKEEEFVKEQQCDVFVIGAGAAGTLVARKCHDAGLGVVIAERNGWGGVCPLRGCEPKKTLADAAHAVAHARDMLGNGLAGDLQLDWPALMRFKRSFTEPVSEAVRKSLEKSGIRALEGRASFNDDGTVAVEGHGSFRADKVVLAVGARPRRLDVPGDELLQTSRDFLELDAVPESVAFIGGGFISFESAVIAAVAGAEVVVIHRSEQVLKGFDEDLTRSLLKEMESLGVRIALNRDVVAVDKDNGGVIVRAKDGKGTEETFRVGKAFLGAGRVPQTDDIGLDRVGVETSPAGVKVNEYLQSVSNDRVFAAGDCAEPGLPLTPVAALQAEVLADNIINGPSATADLSGTASVVFTHPPLVSVGLLEEQARKQVADVTVHSGDAGKWSEHKRIGIRHAGYKILEETGTGRILGAHYLGQHAEEVGNVFGMAIRHGLTRQELLAQPWSYPSFGYALRYMFS